MARLWWVLGDELDRDLSFTSASSPSRSPRAQAETRGSQLASDLSLRLVAISLPPVGITDVRVRADAYTPRSFRVTYDPDHELLVASLHA